MYAGPQVPQQEPRGAAAQDQPHPLLHLHDLLPQVRSGQVRSGQEGQVGQVRSGQVRLGQVEAPPFSLLFISPSSRFICKPKTL